MAVSLKHSPVVQRWIHKIAFDVKVITDPDTGRSAFMQAATDALRTFSNDLGLKLDQMLVWIHTMNGPSIDILLTYDGAASLSDYEINSIIRPVIEEHFSGRLAEA